MAFRDIILGLEIDTSTVPKSLDIVTEAIDFISRQTQKAASDFERFESAAAAAGSSIEAHLGISRATSDIYRDLARSQDNLGKMFARFRIEQLSPFADEWSELNVQIGNVGAAMEDVAAGVPGSGRALATRLAESAVRYASFGILGGKATIRPSTSQSAARSLAQDQILANVRSQFEQRRLLIREQFQESAEARQLGAVRNAIERQAIRTIDDQLFGQLQGLSRRAFQEREGINGQRPGENTQAFEFRRNRSRQLFDLSLKTAGERRELTKEAQDRREQIRNGMRTAEATEQANEKLELILEALREEESEAEAVVEKI
jgi:hypothetical protein